jgi:SNF2 family DNA or RNA helicase
VSLPKEKHAPRLFSFWRVLFLNLMPMSAAFLTPFNPVRLFGMTYADKYWKEIPNPEKSVRKTTSTTAQPYRKIDLSPERGHRKVRKAPLISFWDLIYVVLKPPLTLGDSEEVALPYLLFPYQRKGVEFLISNDSALLADDMGTGKTVMTLVALRILLQAGRARRVLVVCPPSVIYEWQRHLEQWTPDLYAVNIRGSKTKRAIAWVADAHIYVTTYDTLRRDIESELFPSEKLDAFDVVVLDEAHHIKNSVSGRARAVRKLKAKQRWALTGTPVQNQIEDLISLFSFLRPGYLPPNQIYGVSELIKPFFLRRRKQDVMTEAELPPKLQQEYWLTLDKEQRFIYDKVEARIQAEIAGMDNQISEISFRSQIMALKQICNFAPGRASSPKVDVLKEQVEQIVESGRKVIIFSQYVHEGIKKLYAALNPYGVAVIIGQQSPAERTRQIELFKKSNAIHVLLASVKAGGEGLNLVEASYVIHFDHWWNPAVMWQAEDRAHRRGQKEVVNVYSYWMENTIDERIHALLERKKMLFQHLVDDLSTQDVVGQTLTKEDMLELLGVKLVTPQRISSGTNWADISVIDIRERLFSLTPTEFEDLTVRLFKFLGLINAKRIGGSGDRGIDVVAHRKTARGTEVIAAQCKRYKGIVGPEVAREFLGALNAQHFDAGYLVTSGEFSRDCVQFCQTNNIYTIDGLELANNVKKYGLTL